MLTKDQAQVQAASYVQGVKVKAWTTYKDLYLFRVEWPFPGEENMDPFLSVDNVTGETREFSVVAHITPEEFNALKWADV